MGTGVRIEGDPFLPKQMAAMRPSVRSSRRRSLAVVALAIALSIAGCGRTVYTPEVAGVVVAREQLDGTGQSSRITLRDGRSQVVDKGKVKGIVGSGLVPNVGDLFLAGSTPEPWVAGLFGTDPCFSIGGGGTEEGDFITTDVGLRLPKAADFDRRDYIETQHRFDGAGFCVNGSGEVTAIR
jgi:hypothetical protein